MVEKVVAIHIKNDYKCYVCGRKEEELKKIYDDIINELTTKIKETQDQLNHEVDNYKNYIENVLKETEGNPYLVLGYDTLKHDPMEYYGLIPHLDFLLSYAEKNKEDINRIYRIPRVILRSDNIELTLSNVREYLEKNKSSETENAEIIKLREDLNQQISNKNILEAFENHFCKLGEYKITLDKPNEITVDGNVEVIVPLCSICEYM
ncbi:MAG: hypothetical protein ABSB40_09185 [Nitrososphaeria archaeon]|jgi:DNA-binding transcriptional MerR regulator